MHQYSSRNPWTHSNDHHLTNRTNGSVRHMDASSIVHGLKRNLLYWLNIDKKYITNRNWIADQIFGFMVNLNLCVQKKWQKLQSIIIMLSSYIHVYIIQYLNAVARQRWAHISQWLRSSIEPNYAIWILWRNADTSFCFSNPNVCSLAHSCFFYFFFFFVICFFILRIKFESWCNNIINL